MKRAVIGLVASKKFLVALAASTVFVVGRCGLELNTEALDRVCLVMVAFIVAQGIADHGKEAAKVSCPARLPSTEALKRDADDRLTPPGGDNGKEREITASHRAVSRRADTAPLRGPGVVASGAVSVAPSEQGSGGRS
jgi:hypothetical protein